MANPSRDQKGGRPPTEEPSNFEGLPDGDTNERILARLARDRQTDLLGAIESGQMSVHAAAIQAGYRKRKTPEQLVVFNFKKCENKAELLATLRKLV